MIPSIHYHRDTGTGSAFGASADEILFEVLADGSVKLTTDPVSAPNHTAAEGMLRTIADLIGGLTTRRKRRIVRKEHKIEAHVHAKD